MSKLPPRLKLCSILEDAIEDRKALEDPTIQQQIDEEIKAYRELLAKMRKSPHAILTEEDKNTLGKACHAARIWRESYLDCWKGTGEKAVMANIKRDIEWVTKTENALGIKRHWAFGGEMPEGITTVSLFDLMKRNHK